MVAVEPASMIYRPPSMLDHETSAPVGETQGAHIGSGLRIAMEWALAAIVTVVCLHHFLGEAFLERAPASDRGFYIACSKLIANGAVMYRDIFDNKPPMIHLLGAVAWSISPSVRAVFRMEQLALVLLAAALFAMVRFAMGVRLFPALVGLGVGLVALRNPQVFSGGHMTEEYGILFIAVTVTCLGLMVQRTRTGSDGRWWALAAGSGATVVLLTRQTFLASLLAIWVTVHAPLLRRPHDLKRLLLREMLGAAAPMGAWLAYLGWHGGLLRFAELISTTIAFGDQGYKGTVGVRLAKGVVLMTKKVFQEDAVLASATAVVVGLAVVILRMRAPRDPARGGLSPLVLPVWFAAELVAASLPGDFYGHYYLPFVPIWTCAAALVAEVWLPRGTLMRGLPLFRIASFVAVLVPALLTLDTAYRLNPEKFWFRYAPNARLPPAIVERLQADAQRLGWRSYVPLDNQAIAILLDMPLRPGTRFISQYRYSFDGSESPHGQELLRDLARTDVIAEDRERIRLDDDMERHIAAVLRDGFTPLLDWGALRFYARRESPTNVDAGTP